MNLFFKLRSRAEDGSFPPKLTPEEEKDYFRKYLEGSMQAKEILIMRNMRLVSYIVNNYTSHDSSNYHDFLSIGTEALVKSIHKFNPDKKTKFSSFAYKCIENAIRMELRKMKNTKGNVSLYAPLETDMEGAELRWMDILPNEGESVEEKVEKEAIKAMLGPLMTNTLGDMERSVLELRYGLRDDKMKTQEEVSRMLGISRPYVTRIEGRALKKLRDQIRTYEYC